MLAQRVTTGVVKGDQWFNEHELPQDFQVQTYILGLLCVHACAALLTDFAVGIANRWTSMCPSIRLPFAKPTDSAQAIYMATILSAPLLNQLQIPFLDMQ